MIVGLSGLRDIRDVLGRALAELETKGWEPGGLGSYDGPKCAIGAVLKVTGDWKPGESEPCWDHGSITDHSIQLIEAHMFEVDGLDDTDTLDDLAAWNQVPGREFSSIEAAFGGAIEEADDPSLMHSNGWPWFEPGTVR